MDLRKILKSLVRLDLLSETKEEVFRKPGHPFEYSADDKSLSGPKLFYQTSVYEETLRAVLPKPKAKLAIYNYLLESGLLHRHMISVGL